MGVGGRRLLGAAVAALLVLAPAVALASSAARASVAEYEYGLGSAASGKVKGHCVSAAVLFPMGVAGVFALEADGGVLEEYVTQWNTTVVLPDSGNPVIMPEAPRQTPLESVELPAGRTTIDWGTGARVRAFGEGWPGTEPSTPLRSFVAEFDVEGLRTQPPNLDFDAGEYFVPKGEAVGSMKGGVLGWNREVEAYRGTVHVAGNLTFYLEAARVEDPSGRTHELPPAHRTEPVADTPAARRSHHEHRHALLRVSHARLALDAAQAAFGCRDLEATIHGTLVAHGARGHVQAGDERAEFGPADLSVGGRFALTETFVDGGANAPMSVSGRAEGDFDVVGFDFAPAPVGIAPAVVAVAVGSLALAILLAVAGWRLYTRLQTPHLLDLETRGLVYDALRSNPWSTFADIQRATGLNRSTVRYQLAVLLRHGLVRRERAGPVARFAPQADAQVPPPPVDPVVQTLQDQLRPGAARLADVMRALMERHEYSRYGAWKAVRRATREGRIRVDRDGKGVWVRCTP
jgi:DNA-binding transcriptional ArsR family regulator